MAIILEFRSGRSAQHTRRAPRLPLTSGEIVLFPGVRYEYDAPAADVSPKGRRRGAGKRDKLEIK